MSPKLNRAQGALAGALIGDALGSQVEFIAPVKIRKLSDAQLTQLHDGGPWHTLAGQPTEDGELIITISRLLAYCRAYDEVQAKQSYQFWLSTRPFAVTPETQYAITEGALDDEFHAGPLARAIPIALLGQHFSIPQIAAWAMADCALTHSSVLTQQVTALMAMLLAHVIDEGVDRETLLEDAKLWAHDLRADPLIMKALDDAMFFPSSQDQMERYAIVACFQNLIYQLYYAKSFVDAIADTARQGGDTGTRCCVIGAFFGAMTGVQELPKTYLDTLAQCRLQEGVTGVDQPRPDLFWPTDIMRLARQLTEMHPEQLE